jgi:hypothetical protein
MDSFKLTIEGDQEGTSWDEVSLLIPCVNKKTENNLSVVYKEVTNQERTRLVDKESFGFSSSPSRGRLL